MTERTHEELEGRNHEAAWRNRYETLRTLAHDLIPGATGCGSDDHLPWLTEYLRAALDIDIAYIAEFADREERRVTIRAHAGHTRSSTDGSFLIEDTPCGSLVDSPTLVVQGEGPLSAVRLLPFLDPPYSCFVGQLLLDADGKRLGYLAGYGRGKDLDTEHTRAILDLFAARIASELHRERTHRRLLHLVEGTTQPSDSSYFLELARHLSKALDTRFALIAERVDHQRANILAWTDDGQPLEPSTFLITGTPCQALDRHATPLLVQDEFLTRFPNDTLAREHDIVSYLGIPLRSPEGESLGHLAIMDDRPMPARILETPWLPLFAARASSELIRQRNDRARRNAEREIAELRRRDGFSVLASGIAHDFNNYLTAILGNATALETATDPQDRLEHLRELRRASERATELSRRMIDYAGGQRTQVAPLSLSRLAEEMASLLRAALRPGIVLETEFTEDLPDVPGDATQMRQILMNVIMNAGEAMGSRGGTIRIRASLGPLNQKELPSAVIDATGRGEGFVLVEIEDNGPGMSAERLQSILERSYATRSTRRGLGLLIVRMLVRAHAGALWIDSTPDVGTRVRIAFPIVPLPATARSMPEHAIPDRKGGLVLVVEENAGVRNVLTRMLLHLGFETRSHASLEEAVTASEGQTTPRLAILDTPSPELATDDASRTFARRFPNLPCVLMSSHPHLEPARKDRHPGTRVLAKPFELEDLRRVLQQLLSP